MASTGPSTGAGLKAGGVVSTTETSKDAAAALPRASAAEHVTVVEPSANVAPEAGAHDGVTAPSTRSDADAPKTTAAPAGHVASAVTFVGTAAGSVPSIGASHSGATASTNR